MTQVIHPIRGGGPTLNERAGPLPPSEVGWGSLLGRKLVAHCFLHPDKFKNV
jgi:hypothetical protein